MEIEKGDQYREQQKEKDDDKKTSMTIKQLELWCVWELILPYILLDPWGVLLVSRINTYYRSFALLFGIDDICEFPKDHRYVLILNGEVMGGYTFIEFLSFTYLFRLAKRYYHHPQHDTQNTVIVESCKWTARYDKKHGFCYRAPCRLDFNHFCNQTKVTVTVNGRTTSYIIYAGNLSLERYIWLPKMGGIFEDLKNNWRANEIFLKWKSLRSDIKNCQFFYD